MYLAATTLLSLITQRHASFFGMSLLADKSSANRIFFDTMAHLPSFAKSEL